MGAQFDVVYLYMLIPMAAVVGGCVVSAIWKPSDEARSMIQHFAAGVVLAAVAIELLPEVTQSGHSLEITIGFTLGVALMMAIKQVGEWLQTARFSVAGILALMLIVGIDLFVDGLLVGVSFLIGTEEGLFITLALTLEAFFLALAAATTLRNRGQSKVRVILAGFTLAALLGFGAFLGTGLLADASSGLLNGVISFAVAAMLYLVVEELLVEAHKMGETRTATGLFFVGFLCVMMMQILFHSPPTAS